MKAYCWDVWVFFHVFSLSKLRPLSFQTHRRAWSQIFFFLRREITFVVVIFPFWLSSEIPHPQEHLWLFKGGYLKCCCCLSPLHTERRVFGNKSHQYWSKTQDSCAHSSSNRDNSNSKKVDTPPTLSVAQKAELQFTFWWPDEGILTEIFTTISNDFIWFDKWFAYDLTTTTYRA